MVVGLGGGVSLVIRCSRARVRMSVDESEEAGPRGREDEGREERKEEGRESVPGNISCILGSDTGAAVFSCCEPEPGGRPAEEGGDAADDGGDDEAECCEDEEEEEEEECGEEEEEEEEEEEACDGEGDEGDGDDDGGILPSFLSLSGVGGWCPAHDVGKVSQRSEGP